jgi:hypothetical protein
MPYIIWIQEAVLDKVFASTARHTNISTCKHIYLQFKKIVGKAKAEAAMRRYFREMDAA